MKHLSTTVSLLFLSTTLAAQVPSWLPANGLVAWYPFNGNANDESNNDHHLTVFGASLTQDRNGVPSSAYAFNGSNNYMNGGSDGAFAITHDRTLSAWVRYGPSFNNDQGIVGYVGSSGALSGHAGYYLLRRLPENGAFAAYEDSAEWGNTHYGSALSDMPYGPDEWHHVVLWRSGTVTFLYVDGSLQSSSYDLVPYFLNAEFLVGWSGSHGQYLHGEVDDIALWNRALTPDELQQVYAADWTTSMPRSSSLMGTMAYPNPTTGDLRVTDIPQGITPQLFDVTGRCIGTGTTRQGNDATLDLSGQPPGNYVVRIAEHALNVVRE